MKKKETKKRAAPRSPKPKQQRLPGTEDAKIDLLEDLAEEYVDIREIGFDNLKQLTKKGEELLEAMKDAGKTEYRRNGISLKTVGGKEKIKVRVTEDASKGEEEE